MAGQSRICDRFLGFILFLSLAGAAQAQVVTGSTSVSVDNATNLVTATCETDLDGDAQAYYEAVVHCTVFDGYGNQVAYGQYIDHNGNLGYAIAVVTFTGVRGTTYVANGSHLAVAAIQDYALPPAGQPTQYEYLDEYNFGEFQSRPIIYPDSYQWYGPGPPEQRRASSITIGGTTSRRVDPFDTVLLTQHALQDFATACDSAFSRVIGTSYTKAAFFQSLLNTTISQYPFGAPNMPTDYGSELNLPFADTQVSLPGRPIRLFPNFYGSPGHYTSDLYREAMLTHEGVHHFTGWTDATVFTNFYSSGLREPDGTTNDFSLWIQAKCPNPWTP